MLWPISLKVQEVSSWPNILWEGILWNWTQHRSIDFIERMNERIKLKEYYSGMRTTETLWILPERDWIIKAWSNVRNSVGLWWQHYLLFHQWISWVLSEHLHFSGLPMLDICKVWFQESLISTSFMCIPSFCPMCCHVWRHSH